MFDSTPPIENALSHFLWALPFAGVLISLAVLPMLTPRFWGKHYGKWCMLWLLSLVLALTLKSGWQATLHLVMHALVLDYLPFIVLIGSLYIITSAIHVHTEYQVTPWTNTVYLGLGGLLASLIGTTGASLILIRPLIRLNQRRTYSTHIFIFFIFVVSNIGGALTPIGDPPLFMGFLKGVPFFWPLVHLGPITFFTLGLVLGAFFCMESYFLKKEGGQASLNFHFRVDGKLHVALLACAILSVLLSGIFSSGPHLNLFGLTISVASLLRDLALMVLAGISYKAASSNKSHRNHIAWHPIEEVAILFLAIFVTMIPVVELVKLYSFKPQTDFAYFFVTGLLSSFLDNTPTYLVFFNVAGGNPLELIGPLASTLAAISAGAVFMGANTYIGNAPNLMVAAICRQSGIKMPSFFGFLGWSTAILVPIFVIVGWIFFLK